MKHKTHISTGDCITDARVWVRFYDESLPCKAVDTAREAVDTLNLQPRSGYPWEAYPDTSKDNVWHYEMPLCVAQQFMAHLDDDRNVADYARE